MRILVRLTGLAWKHKWTLIAAYACLLISSFAFLALPKLLGTAIDSAIKSGLRSSLIYLALAVVGVSAVRGISAFWQTYLGEVLSQKVAYDLRNAFYDRLQHLSFAYHDQQHTGNLMSRATVDVENIRMFINFGLIRTLQVVILLVGVAVIMLTSDWKLALLSLCFTPLLVYRSVVLSRAMRKTWLRIQELLGQMTTVLQENLIGVRVVKSFAAEDYERQKFDDKAWRVSEENMEANRLQAVNAPLITFVFTIAMGLILWYGGRQVVNGSMTAGEISTFLFYMGILGQPVRMSGWLINSFSRASSSGERIFQILDTQSPVREKPDAVELPRVEGYVRFENVSFGYRPATPAIRGIDLEVKPGQVVALLGAPGSGKSTIVHLLPRFYDVDGGRITVDSIDVRDATLESLRRNVGIVLQDVFLFTSTIKENISYGSLKASDGEIIQAAKVAQLHDFIASLPQGYDTWVGERGVTLSGGQRQRLAIARTILLNPPILILDDSTSSVDANTEHLIRQALNYIMSGRTTFVIAHRLSTVRRADLILVLDNGQIIERGTHEELLEIGGKYREIHDLQLRPQEEVLLETTLSAGDGVNRT